MFNMNRFCTDCTFDLASISFERLCKVTSLQHIPFTGSAATVPVDRIAAKKPAITVISDDEVPPVSSGSNLSARIRTAKRDAGKRDALKPVNRSKYSIGAPAKSEARTFT